jgi:Subtilase family
MSSEGKVRLLVKAAGPVLTAPMKFGLSDTPVKLNVKPLFTSIGSTGGLAAAPTSNWHIVETELPASDISQWELCHALAKQGAGFAPGGVEIVEPDLEQKWPIGPTLRGETAFAIREGDTKQQDASFPTDPDNYWFRNAIHGSFGAIGELPDPGPGKRVRIAHLDTGYDPNHATRPAFLRTDLQRNFVDDDFPNDATDRSNGLLNNFSHGTGTLSILAGAAPAGQPGFGCAPGAEIIPIRVANRVVLFRNSAIAQALDYVHSLCRKPETFVHVVTMSMGGLPSQAWADAINALYELGVFVVTAAGNNYANLPSHYIVYPARFDRVVAACGTMADGKPYADLAPTLMAGDYGPTKKMATAISAYTPNVPWARFGSPQTVDFDGAGTSAATPQVAATAALWIQKNRAKYDSYAEPWMRAEAVRVSLFETADTDHADAAHFGAGRIKAQAAVNHIPAGPFAKQAAADASGALLDILVGQSLVASPNAMLNLELSQVLQTTGLEVGLENPLRTSGASQALVGQLLAIPTLSAELRAALSRGGAVATSAPPPAAATVSGLRPNDRLNLELARAPEVPPPAFRQLRVFAYDPSTQTDPRMFGLNEAVVSVPWETDLKEGPTGEYLEVVDVDPASGCCYAPVDLNHPHLLATNGYPPSEANPQFHQQMVYAVAMRTIVRFERALGRKALWAERFIRDTHGGFVDRRYVQRLRIYPHAMREGNAYYSSQKMALLFGYFAADKTFAGNALPGSQIFCAVSHDIVAHETTHALLDGLHPRFQEATNTDVLAFHEAFADIIAMFLHFTMPESLLQQIKRAKGDLSQETLLGQLAVQFGQASGKPGALRSAIGMENAKHEWQPVQPNRTDYDDARNQGDPHILGSVLVSAVFAAFVTIYRGRSADLIRLSTNGTGILPAGEISHDLAQRLAQEAATVADQVLNICIRALDYVPPIDITFGEYLRALITADRDLVPDDSRGYRVAFIAAFRDRGILPKDVRHLAEDSLVWLHPPLDAKSASDFASLVQQLKLDWNLNSDRRSAYDTSRENQELVHRWLVQTSRKPLLDAMGLEAPAQRTTIQAKSGDKTADMTGEMRPIEVHSVRPTRRTAPDGTSHGWLIIEVTQGFWCETDGEKYRGGCTAIVDLNTNKPKYFIRKRLRGGAGAEMQRSARIAAAAFAAENNIPYISPGDHTSNHEAFALLHRTREISDGKKSENGQNSSGQKGCCC